MSSDRVGIFIGGVQKCGTTSLHSYFEEHSRLRAPRKKETHFFDNERIDWAKPDYDSDFHQRFYPDLNGKALAYDATPISIFWPPSIGRILDYNPAARFIFLFRDPIERAFSHWRMEYGRDAETLPFCQAIREGRRRLDDLPELHPDRRVFSYVERGLYAGQLDRALRRLPRQQMLILASAELAARPSSALAKVAEFLSIEPFADVAPRRIFSGAASSERVSADDIAYLSAIFRDDIERFSEMSSIDISDWPACTGVMRDRD